MMPDSITAVQKRAIELRVIEILLTIHNYYNYSLKKCGLYQMPNKRKNIIIDRYPTIEASKTIMKAYNIAKTELLDSPVKTK